MGQHEEMCLRAVIFILLPECLTSLCLGPGVAISLSGALYLYVQVQYVPSLHGNLILKPSFPLDGLVSAFREAHSFLLA